MTRPSDPTPPRLEPTVVAIDRIKHRQLREILTYIEGIHHEIDPDMYRIRPRDLEAMANLLVHGALGPRASLSHDELVSVELLVSAAWTYSHRGRGNGLPGVRQADFEKLMLWIGRAHRAILRAAGLPVIDLEDR